MTAAVYEYRVLNTTEAAAGVDGYYYVLQVQSLLDTGRPYYQTITRLPIYTFAALAAISGDTIAAVKTASVMLHMLLCLGVFAILHRTTRSKWLGLVGSWVLLIPTSRFYLLAEFLNQLTAVTLLVWSGWALIRAKQTGRRMWFLFSAVFGTAAMFSHKSASVIVVTIVASFAAVGWLHRDKRRAAVAILGVVICASAPAIIAAQELFAVPQWLQSQVSAYPQNPLKTPFLAEGILLIIVSVVMLIVLLRTGNGLAFNRILAALALWSLIVTMNPFLNPGALLSGLAGRLRVVSHVQLGLLLPPLICILWAAHKRTAYYLVFVAVILLLASGRGPWPRGLQPEYLSTRNSLIRALKDNPAALAPNSIVIAPHGDQFVVTATLGLASQQRPPRQGQYQNFYWLLNDVMDEELASKSIVLFRKYSMATIIIDDHAFQSYWRHMTDKERRDLLSANPHLNGSRRALAAKFVDAGVYATS